MCAPASYLRKLEFVRLSLLSASQTAAKIGISAVKTIASAKRRRMRPEATT